MSRKAQKLFERAKNTKAGWKARELVSLYKGFGFTIREGKGSHKIVSHPKYNDLDQVFVMHGNEELSKAYVEDAVDLITLLLEREAEATKTEDEADESDEQ